MAQNMTEAISRAVLLLLGIAALAVLGFASIYIILHYQKTSLTETEKNPLTNEISIITNNSIVVINLTNSRTRPILITLTYTSSNCTDIKVAPRTLAVILPPNTTVSIIFKVEKQTLTTCNLTFRLSETFVTERKHLLHISPGYPIITPAIYRGGVEEGEEGIRGGEEIGGVGEGVGVGEG